MRVLHGIPLEASQHGHCCRCGAAPDFVYQSLPNYSSNDASAVALSAKVLLETFAWPFVVWLSRKCLLRGVLAQIAHN